MSSQYVRYLLKDEDFHYQANEHVVLMDLQADYDKIGPYYLELGVDDMSSDPFPEYVQAVGYLQDGKLLGFLMLMHLEDDGTLEIAAVSVHPSARGKGLGKALISKGAEEVLKRNKTPSLTTKETNLAMRLCAEGIGMKLKD